MKKNAKPSAPADKQREMPLTFTNYKLMLIGLAIIVLGFVLMAGGGSDDPKRCSVSAGSRSLRCSFCSALPSRFTRS